MNINPERYKNFSSKDFSSDPFFQEWVMSPTVKTREFWKIWLDKNPHKQNSVDKARAFLLDLNLALSDAQTDFEKEIAAINRSLDLLDQGHDQLLQFQIKKNGQNDQ